MKCYIVTDLEGPAMVWQFAQTRDVTEEPELKRQAMRLLTGEVNAAVDGILDACPEAEVIVWDGHGNGGIDIEAFHPKAKLISRGRIRPPYGLDASFHGVFFVGQHAMAGTENATLCHTYSSKSIEYYKLNGRFVGEFGARALMAATLGVPTVFVSGDDKVAAEARALVPRIHAAVVKWGLGLELALHRAPAAARSVVRQTAREAALDAATIPPPDAAPPFVLELRVKPGVSIEGYLKRGAERVNDLTVRLRSDRLCELPV